MRDVERHFVFDNFSAVPDYKQTTFMAACVTDNSNSRIKTQGIREAVAWFFGTYLRPYAALMLVIVLAMLAQILAIVYFTDFVQTLTREMFFSPNQAPVVTLCLTVVGVFAVRGLTSMTYRAGLEHMIAKALAALRLDLATHIWSVKFSALDTHNSSDLAARIGNNINELREHIVQSFSASFLGIFTLIGLTGYLFYLDVWLALIMLGAFAIIGLGLSLVNKFIKRIRERALMAFSDLSVELEGFIVGQRSIRLNNIGRWFLGQIGRTIKTTELAARRQGYLLGLLAPLVDFTIGLSIAFVIFIGFAFLSNGQLSAPEMSAFFVALIQLYSPLKRVTNLGALLRNISVTIGSIRWVFDLPPEQSNAQVSDVEGNNYSVAGDINFEDVTFGYPSNIDQVLTGFSAIIPGGKLTMIVGESGSGKSTLPALLLGLYPFDQGNVCLNGQPLSIEQRRQLRQYCSYVGQDTTLLNASAADNLLPYQNDRSESVEAIFQLVELDTVPSIIDGVPLGSRGTKLSGGQRQRMALAQALTARNPIAIFDEPTSALDSSMAQRMVQTIKSQRQGQTTIMIVHDHGLLTMADHVIRMP